MNRPHKLGHTQMCKNAEKSKTSHFLASLPLFIFLKKILDTNTNKYYTTIIKV